MPPIFGILKTNVQEVNPDMIHRMKEAAVYVKPREVFSKELKGGFMASSVAKDNPLVPGEHTIASSENLMVVADASLYKKEQLISELFGPADQQTPGPDYPTPDSLLILQSWLKWGKDCLKHLYGDFAFVICNTETGEIFCGRDHLGVKPFFYSFINDTFIFASELRIVLAALPERPSVSLEYLLDSLVTKKSCKSESPFESIKRLSPAHFLHISEGRMDLQNYWHLDPERRLQLNDEKEYTCLLKDKLVKAVETRCVGAKTGAELSGGLDSSAITGISANYLKYDGKILTTYSNVFPEGTEMNIEDEKQHIAEMVKFTSVKWNGIAHLSRNIPDLLFNAIGVQGCFIQQNFSMLCDALYEAAGRDNINVLLSGFGGDEMVSARTGVQWNELISKREWNVFRDELFHKGFNPKSLFKAGYISLRYLYSLFNKPGKTSGVFTKELLDGRFRNIPLQESFSNKHMLRQRLADQYIRNKRSILAMKQFDRIMHDHVPQRMEYCYAAAAQHGIEYRYPLLDVDLLETFLAFPAWMKQHHGVNRYAFRQAIEGFVPETIRNRNDKSGATIPQTFYSFRNEREHILDVIHQSSRSSKLKEIFDFKKFEHWYQRIVDRDPKDMNYLMPGAFYTYLMILLYYKKCLK